MSVLLVVCWTSPVKSLKDISAGQLLPSFSLYDLEGNNYTEEDLKGSSGVIIFWSTWSPRSLEILEDFRKYHKEYTGHGLKILAVNIDGENLSRDQKNDIRDFAKRMDLPFPVLMDDNLEAFVAYGVMAHPSAVVFGPEGMIAYTLGGYPDSLREELKNSFLKVLGIYVEPEKPEVTSVGYVPRGSALQYYNMGRKLMSLGQVEKAIDAFHKSVEQDPKFFEPSIMSARLSLSIGDASAAEEFLKQVDIDEVNRNDLRFLAGNMMLFKGNPFEAQAIFRTIQEKSPDEGWGLWGLGLVALSRDDVESALSLMEKASKYQPENFEAENHAQKYLRRSWLRGQSVAQEERFLNIFPSLKDSRDRLKKLFSFPGVD